jgi:hypothetical protein
VLRTTGAAHSDLPKARNEASLGPSWRIGSIHGKTGSSRRRGAGGGLRRGCAPGLTGRWRSSGEGSGLREGIALVVSDHERLRGVEFESVCGR